MVCKEELCTIFQNLQPHKRIDLMCGLLHLCLPIELRFLGSFMEDLGKKDFHYLREYELKANNISEIEDLLENDDRTLIHKLAIYLSLLYSNHGSCSNALYKVLVSYLDRTVQSQQSNFDILVLQELLTILTIAYNHPAFTFEQRSIIYERYHQLEQRSHTLQQDIGAVLSAGTSPASLSDSLDNHLRHYHHHPAWNTCLDDVISLSNPVHQETLHREPPYMMYQTACDSPMSSTTSRSSSPSHAASPCGSNMPIPKVCSVAHLLDQLQLTAYSPILAQYSIEQLRNLRDEDLEMMQLPYSDIQKIRARLKLFTKDIRHACRPDTSVPPPGYIFPQPPPLLPPAPHHYPLMVYTNPGPLAAHPPDDRSSNDDSSGSDDSKPSSSQQRQTAKKNRVKHDSDNNQIVAEPVKLSPHDGHIPYPGPGPVTLPPGIPMDAAYLYRPPMFAVRHHVRPVYVTRTPHHQIPYLCYPKPPSALQDISLIKPSVLLSVPPPPLHYGQPAIGPYELIHSNVVTLPVAADIQDSRAPISRKSDSPAVSPATGGDNSPGLPAPVTTSSAASPMIYSRNSRDSTAAVTSVTPGGYSPVISLSSDVSNVRQDQSARVVSSPPRDVAVERTTPPSGAGAGDLTDFIECAVQDDGTVNHDDFNNLSISASDVISVVPNAGDESISQTHSPSIANTFVTGTVVTSSTATIMCLSTDSCCGTNDNGNSVSVTDLATTRLDELQNLNGLSINTSQIDDAIEQRKNPTIDEQKNAEFNRRKNTKNIQYNKWKNINFDEWKQTEFHKRNNSNMNEWKNPDGWKNTRNNNMRMDSHRSHGNDNNGYYYTDHNYHIKPKHYPNNGHCSSRGNTQMNGDVNPLYTNAGRHEHVNMSNSGKFDAHLGRFPSPADAYSSGPFNSRPLSVSPKPPFATSANLRDGPSVGFPGAAVQRSGDSMASLRPPYAQRAITGQNGNQPPPPTSPSLNSPSRVTTPPNTNPGHNHPQQRPPLLRAPNGVPNDLYNNAVKSGGNGGMPPRETSARHHPQQQQQQPQKGAAEEGKGCYNCGMAGHAASDCTRSTLQSMAGHYHLDFQPKQETHE